MVSHRPACAAVRALQADGERVSMAALTILLASISIARAGVSVSIGTTTIGQCQTVQVSISGGVGPYVVDATRLAGDPAPIGLVNLPPKQFFQNTCDSVPWQSVIAAGTAFRIRAIDATGQWAFSPDICVKPDSAGQCGAIVRGSSSSHCGAQPISEPCDTSSSSTPMTWVTVAPSKPRDLPITTETPCETETVAPQEPAPLPQYSQPEPQVPDCQVEGPCDSGNAFFSVKAALLRLYEELFFEILFACSLGYAALL